MNWAHKNFQCNGHSFNSKKEFINYSYEISSKLHSFLKDWFSTEDHLIVKTSGSTGIPKPIRLKKKYMQNSAKATGDYFNLQEKTTALCCLPIDFIAGKMMIVRALTLGWHIDIIDPEVAPLKNIDRVYDFCAMVPLQVHNSLKKMNFVKKMIVGGGAISTELEAQLQNVSTQVYATYGMTETITHIAVRTLNRFQTVISKELTIEKSYYKTLPSVTISIDDRNCLVIDAPKVSDEKIITNDVIEILSEDEFQWKGRYDNVINSGGLKLHPEEIEEKLSAIFSSRFFVIGVPYEELGEKLVLVIEGKEDSSIATKVKSLATLNKYEVPKQIIFIDQFLETDTGKIRRQASLEKSLE